MLITFAFYLLAGLMCYYLGLTAPHVVLKVVGVVLGIFLMAIGYCYLLEFLEVEKDDADK